MKSIEVSARTIEEAVSDGLSKLGCSIADCKVEILQEGAKGLFGLFGSKPATVRLTLLAEGDDDGDSLGINLQDALTRDTEMPRARPAQEARPPKKPQQAKAQPKPQAQEKQPAEKPAQQPASEKSKMRIAANPQVLDNKNRSSDVLERFKNAPLPVTNGSAPAPEKAPPQEKRAAQPKPPRAPRQREPQRERIHHEPQDEAMNAEPVVRVPVPAPENIVRHDAETPEGIAQQFLTDVTHRMGVDVQVDVHTGEDGHVFATMYGDTLGILIGRRGETLDALQYLTSLQVNRGREEYIRVTLDTENYRAKREEALNRLASRMANRAIKTGRKVALEPMNPYERRILHASLQNNPGVTTHSEGDEPYRHVVVVPER